MPPSPSIPGYSRERRSGHGSAGVGTRDDYHISMLRPVDGLVVAQASGEVDFASSYAFTEQLLTLLDEQPTRIVVDLSGVAYVDTYALSAVADLAKRCRLEDCGLAIVCSEGRMRRALAKTGLDQLVATHATLDEALGHGDSAP
jgi:anti-sigma B factor antagonist